MRTSVKKRLNFARCYLTHLLEQAGYDNAMSEVNVRRWRDYMPVHDESERRTVTVAISIWLGGGHWRQLGWAWHPSDPTSFARRTMEEMVRALLESAKQ